ncbi:MAG: hypothetical protein NVS1B4_07880 [Gemmatimonadaceae bacterium]
MILMQVERAIPSSPMELVTNATTVTQVVLVFLALLSVVSWTIIIMKWLEFRAARRMAQGFVDEFARATRLAQARALVKRARPSSFTRIFGRAVDFLSVPRPASGVDAAETPALSGSHVEALRLILDSETSQERDRLGRFIPTLATIGSVSPLIGLLGTVLGIIQSFLGIATKGSGNIGAVAPGVAEALIATAAALSVAIPAVFGYNLFANRLNRFEGELESFGSAIIALLVREGQL